MLYRTLVDIRSDIQSRLGFGMAGKAGVVNSGLIDSMIRSAQRQLYEQFDWLHLRSVLDRDLGANQQYMDYPDDCNIERIQQICVKWGGRYVPLIEGIDLVHRNVPSAGPPLRYERRDQIEVWPVPASAEYALRVEYIKQLSALNLDTDRVSLPDELVYLHALSNAKSHYRQPDAQTYASQLEALLNRLKAGHRSRTVWGAVKSPDPYSRVDGSQDSYA